MCENGKMVEIFGEDKEMTMRDAVICIRDAHLRSFQREADLEDLGVVVTGMFCDIFDGCEYTVFRMLGLMCESWHDKLSNDYINQELESGEFYDKWTAIAAKVRCECQQ